MYLAEVCYYINDCLVPFEIYQLLGNIELSGFLTTSPHIMTLFYNKFLNCLRTYYIKIDWNYSNFNSKHLKTNQNCTLSISMWNKIKGTPILKLAIVKKSSEKQNLSKKLSKSLSKYSSKSTSKNSSNNMSKELIKKLVKKYVKKSRFLEAPLVQQTDSELKNQEEK